MIITYNPFCKNSTRQLLDSFIFNEGKMFRHYPSLDIIDSPLENSYSLLKSMPFQSFQHVILENIRLSANGYMSQDFFQKRYCSWTCPRPSLNTDFLDPAGHLEPCFSHSVTGLYASRRQLGDSKRIQQSIFSREYFKGMYFSPLPSDFYRAPRTGAPVGHNYSINHD